MNKQILLEQETDFYCQYISVIETNIKKSFVETQRKENLLNLLISFSAILILYLYRFF